MVEQPARRGNQDVGAAIELLVLLIEGHTANKQRHRQLVVLSVDDEILLDLGGKLARRLDNQRARHAGAGASLLQERQHRQHEAGGLAGTCLGDADDVAALQHMRDRLRLDRSRFLVASRIDGGQNLRAQT